MMTFFGWGRKHVSPNHTPYRYANHPLPSLGAETLTFQAPQLNPIDQWEGAAMAVQTHRRIAEPLKWSVQMVVMDGLPATIGSFHLDALVDANFRPYE